MPAEDVQFGVHILAGLQSLTVNADDLIQPQKRRPVRNPLLNLFRVQGKLKGTKKEEGTLISTDLH